MKGAFAMVGAALKLAGGALTGVRLHGAAPLGGTFGDGKGTSRLRRKLRAGMKSKASSTIAPKIPRVNGKTLAIKLLPEPDESPAWFAEVGEPLLPWPVPVPCVFVLVPVGAAPGETPTVGDVCAPGVVADVGDGTIARVAPGEGVGLAVVVGEGLPVAVGDGVEVTVGDGVEVTVGEGVVVPVGDGVVVSVGEGVVVSVGDGVLVSVGVTSL